MSEVHVEVHGQLGKILVDGIDISKSASGFKVEMEAGGSALLTVRYPASHLIIDADDAGFWLIRPVIKDDA